MAQWMIIEDMLKSKKIQMNDLRRIYSKRTNFSIQFRGRFATWIESQDWDEYAKQDDVEEKGRQMYEKMIQMMEKDMEGRPIMESLDLSACIENFKDAYEGNYQAFINLMIHILKSERILIHSTQEDMGRDRHFDEATENKKITADLQALESELRKTESQVRRLGEKQEKLNLRLMEIKVMKTSEEATKSSNELQDLSTQLYEMRKNTILAVKNVCDKMSEIFKESWIELDQFKNDQQLACTMMRKPKEGTIGILDAMFEDIAATFRKLMSQVDRLKNLLQEVTFKEDSYLHIAITCHEEMNQMLEEHVRRVFIVDKNIPKQVLKVINGRSLGFSMSVRLLGGYALGLDANNPKVSVGLYPEHKLNAILEREDLPPFNCNIQNSKDKPFQFQNERGCHVAFDNMIVSGVKRECRGRNDEYVTTYKHAFVFSTTVMIQGKILPLKAVSLPIVITSQTSQECMARGTIIWSAAFLKPPESRKTMFEAEEEVQWTSFVQVLNALFVGLTKRALTDDNLHFLATKAFKDSSNLNFNSLCISQKAIFKEKMAGCNFPFWKWFMACLNSVKDNVSSEWREGLIYGFISKTKAEEILCKEEPGTFLIRFSESNIEQGQRADIHGYLTVAVVEVHPEHGQKMVFHIKQNLSPKDLSEKELAPVLDAYQTRECHVAESQRKLLRTLWTPERHYPFKEAFGNYIKEKETQNDGYWRGQFIIEISLSEKKRDSCSADAIRSPMNTQSESSEMNMPMGNFFQNAPSPPLLQQPPGPQPIHLPLSPAFIGTDQPMAMIRPINSGTDSASSLLDNFIPDGNLDEIMRSLLVEDSDGDVMLS